MKKVHFKKNMIHQCYTASVQRNLTNFIPVNCNFQNYLFRFGHLMERTVLVRVYSGSVAAPQPGLFKTATAKLPKSVLSSTRFEYCSKENARRWNWSPMELMAWLYSDTPSSGNIVGLPRSLRIN